MMAAENPFDALFGLGAAVATLWMIPANETYDIRTTFTGSPMGQGLVGCWIAETDIFRVGGSFPVLDS